MYTLENHKAFVKALRVGAITADELRAAFAGLTANADAVKAELNRRTLKQLAPGGTRGDTKAQIIERIYSDMMSRYIPGGSFSWSPFSETCEAAINRHVAAVTDDDIQEYARKIAAAQAEHEKAITNPETLREFETFITHKGADALTLEQRAQYDAIRAGRNWEKKERELEQRAKVAAVQLDGVSMEIKKHYHGKRGHDVFIVTVSERVERETFNELATKARQLGGNYARSFQGSPAGFQFNSQEQAQQFVDLQSGDVSRADTWKEQKAAAEQTAAQRLQEMAAAMEQEARDILEADRKVNTHRRAAMAASAESSARSLDAFARTVRNVAAAMERGECQHLKGIRHRSHIETLERIANRAKYNRERSLNLSYDSPEHREFRAQPICLEDIEHTQYPYPFVSVSFLGDVVRAGNATPGAILSARRVAKVIKAIQAKPDRDGGHLSNTRSLEALEDIANKLSDSHKWTREQIKDKLEDYKRVRLMGLDDSPTLRAALREFIQYRGEALKPDPVTMAERELIGCKYPGYFPTPRAVVARMLDEADIEPDHRVLEPSAGAGHIAEAAAADGGKVHAVEINHTLHKVLALKAERSGFEAVRGDFFGQQIEREYDRVLMNPPFEHLQDIDHVQHAFKFLKPGGRLVAIMGEGAFFRTDRKAAEFRAWLDDMGGTSEQLPQGSFQCSDNPTGVNTRLVVIDAPSCEPVADSCEPDEEPAEVETEPVAVMMCSSSDSPQLALF